MHIHNNLCSDDTAVSRGSQESNPLFPPKNRVQCSRIQCWTNSAGSHEHRPYSSCEAACPALLLLLDMGLNCGWWSGLFPCHNMPVVPSGPLPHLQGEQELGTHHLRDPMPLIT